MPPVPMGKEKLEASRNLQAVRQVPIATLRNGETFLSRVRLTLGITYSSNL